MASVLIEAVLMNTNLVSVRRLFNSREVMDPIYSLEPPHTDSSNEYPVFA